MLPREFYTQANGRLTLTTTAFACSTARLCLTAAGKREKTIFNANDVQAILPSLSFHTSYHHQKESGNIRIHLDRTIKLGVIVTQKGGAPRTVTRAYSLWEGSLVYHQRGLLHFRPSAWLSMALLPLQSSGVSSRLTPPVSLEAYGLSCGLRLPPSHVC